MIRVEPERVGDIVVRDANTDDADAVASVHVAAWQFAYEGKLPDEVLASRTLESRRDFWRKRLASLDPREIVLVAEEDGRAVGFAHFTPTDEEGGDPEREARWHSLYLDPRAVGKGIAHALVRGGAARLEELGYESFVFWRVAANTRAKNYFDTELTGGETGQERVVESGRVREVLWRESVAELSASLARAPARRG